MSATSNFDVDSIGGGMSGLGTGSGSFPLWLLLFAGLSKNGGLFGGNNDSSNIDAKVDCLSQGQNVIRDQIADNGISRQFESLASAVAELAGIERDNSAAIVNQLNDLARQNAECCCDLKAGQQEVKTAIAMQTNELNTVANTNTQRILDKMCEQATAVLQQDNDRLRQQLSEQTIISALSKGNS